MEGIPETKANQAAHRPPFPHIEPWKPSALWKFMLKSYSEDGSTRISPSAPIPVLLVQSSLICVDESVIERLLLSITIKSFPAPESLLKLIFMRCKVFGIWEFFLSHHVGLQWAQTGASSALILYYKTIAHQCGGKINLLLNNFSYFVHYCIRCFSWQSTLLKFIVTLFFYRFEGSDHV